MSLTKFLFSEPSIFTITVITEKINGSTCFARENNSRRKARINYNK